MTDERKRLQALSESGLLDSEPIESLQRFVRIAQLALGVPVVLISLVDEDRQFFANSVGLPSPWAERRETPLSHSFCKHVVQSRSPLVVTDALTDPRVNKNLAIRDLGVLAYAGFPIDTEDSQTVGSFCAIDGRPHQWTDRELSLLKDIAAGVSAEVNLRRRMQRVEKSERALARLNDDLLEGQAQSVDLEKTFRHDLRSPLQVITLGITTILRSADFQGFPELARSLTLIQRNAAHAISMINLMKKSESQLEGLVAANDVVLEAIQGYRHLDSSVTLREDCSDDLRIRINPTNLRRCAENLLSNAIRFARSRIDVSLRGEGARAVLIVEDDGPGLPSEQAYQDVWASGVTYHSNLGRSQTGLGLNIVQSIVERAGGTVSAGPSSLGGARFALWLPLDLGSSPV